MANEQLDLIEEITRNDHTTYLEISNMKLNGRAELAAIRGFIKGVKILQLNIPHSSDVAAYEEYINEHYEDPGEKIDQWVEYTRDQEAQEHFETILKTNHISNNSTPKKD